MDMGLPFLDADGLLAAAEANERVIERAELRRLEIAAAWADLHGALRDPDLSGALPGSERMVPFAGDGAPEVAEFAPAELGAVLAVSDDTAADLIGDALNLRHRLPLLWARLHAREVKPWVGRRIARVTGGASAEAAGAVDRRVAPFAHSLPVGRLEKVAQAAMIVADPLAAQRAANAARDDQGVWVAREVVDGYRDILIRTDAASAIQFDSTVDRVADGLGALGDTESKSVRRGKAIGVLASPQQALDLFTDAFGDERAPIPVDARPKATLYVHLADGTLRAGSGSARVEGVGPVVAQQVREWLGRCDLTVRPVLEVAGIAPVDSYEVPDTMREAVFLRSPADTFPFAAGGTRRMDLDDTIAYISPDEGGPPGQTGLGNLAPLTRRHHRIKTHGGWAVRKIAGDGAYLWRSPHGRHYLVDQAGTTPVAAAPV